MPQVQAHRLRAEEEACADLLVGRSVRGKQGNLELSRRQAVHERGIARSACLPARPQFLARAIAPRTRPKTIEFLEGRPEVLPGLDSRPRPAQPLPPQQLCPGTLEWRHTIRLP